MCGRFALSSDEKEINKRFHAVSGEKLDVQPSYNIAPGQLSPIVLRRSPNELTLAKFGMIPRWYKEPKMRFATFNARSETVFSKPMYRTVIRKQRCLVPANSYYEWTRDERHQPFNFHLRKNNLFGFAAVWESWKDAEDHETISFSILTKPAGAAVMSVHPRQPMILKERDEPVWLDTDITDPKDFQYILKDSEVYEDLEGYEVSKDVGNIRNNDKKLIDPTSELRLRS